MSCVCGECIWIHVYNNAADFSDTIGIFKIKLMDQTDGSDIAKTGSCKVPHL